MLAVLIVLQTAASSASVPPSNTDIIVMGRNVEGAKRALEACVVRQCPPNEEIRAALVYSDRQFLAGNYAAARDTLLKTRHRTAKFDSEYPKEVSDLHRALNTMANLDGLQDAARLSAFDATDALRAGLAPDDPLILLQRLETARQFLKEGQLTSSKQILNDVASKAHKKGYYSVEAQALFQGAALFATLAISDPGYRTGAKLWRDRIARRTEAEFAQYRDALALLDAQIATLAVKRRDRDRVLVDAKPVATSDAVLLREPEAPQFGLMGNGANTKPEWADIAFWVRVDGSVDDATVIGRSESKPGPWLEHKLMAVAGRRYAPLKLPADARGLYRVERYSMVYPLIRETGSRVAVRSMRGHLETTDLTLAYRHPPAE